MNPLVTFVVPCYKLAHLLPQCVHSILKQTYQNYEVLIMDNCSPDNTPEVAASFRDPRVRHIRNETNLGHVRNFNKGITLARGKYVWVFSADDWLATPETLGRYVALMERDPAIGFAFCRAIEVQGSTEKGIASWTNLGDEDRVWEVPSFLKQLFQGNCVVLSSAMVRKECFEKVGMFSLEMPHANDWYLWCLLSVHYQVGYLAEPLVCVRMHEESLTTAFTRGGNSLCITDELTALWRTLRLAEEAGVISDRRPFNDWIALSAGRALTYGQRGRALPGLSQADLDALIRQHIRDSNDEADFRARLQAVVGDEEFWHGEQKKAAHAYWQVLKLRPWSMRTWAKVLLLQTGGIGVSFRRWFSPGASPALRRDDALRSR